MRPTFNKKKINFLPGNKLIKYTIIYATIIFLSFTLYDEVQNKVRLKKLIQSFSEKYSYQFKIYEINYLYRIDKDEISKIIDTYLDQSIFLVPLSDISNSLQSLKWVKSVNLSTNLKNKIKLEIYEYKPIGIYSLNTQMFYFSEEGQIIDQFKGEMIDNFILFFGKQSLSNAKNFLYILNKIQQFELLNIKEAHYINERRWNIKLENEISVFLSEKDIESSLRNYIKLISKLKDSEIVSIQSIDLRNNEKAIIKLK
jgi:cell division septal protein FtsQ